MDFRVVCVAFLPLLLGLSHAETIEFIDCGSAVGKVSEVAVVPCPQQPCVLHKGRSYTVTVTFASETDSKTSRAVVHGVILGIPILFPIHTDDGCKSGIHCPIQNQKTYRYVYQLPVRTEYPAIRLVVQWELRDDSSKDFFCIKFPIKMVS